MALLAGLPRTVFSGIVHRVVKKGVDPVSTEGSLKNGGRYNPPEGFGALYASFKEKTASSEVARALMLQGIDPSSYPIDFWWVYEIKVEVENVLDLTNINVLARLNITIEDLIGQDITLTQKIGIEAKHVGYQAIIVPSAAVKGGKNLVFLDATFSGLKIDIRSSRPIQL